MRIVDIDVLSYEPRFLGDGYNMSFGNQTQLFHRLIRLTGEGGRQGIGELVHPATYDLSTVLALEDAHLKLLSGTSLSDLPALLKKWRGGGKLLQGMVHGVELAMFDLMGRVLDVPVSSLLGGAVVRDMPEYLSLSCDTPESMAKVVRSRGTVFPVIQAKMSGDIDSDLQRVQHVLEAMNRDQILLADFNCALRPEDAIRALSEVRDGRLMWEEPCEGYESNLAVARAIEMPVMFDQCLDGLPAFMRAIEDKAAAALVIKPDVIGGLSIGRIARDICAEAGIPIRIDGWWSGQISASGALHLAAGAATSALMATIDLTDPLDTDRSLINKPVAGRVAPANGPGLGALPSDLFRLMSSTCRGLSRDLT